MLSERLFIKGRKSLNLYQFYKYLSSLQTVTQHPTSGYPSGRIPLLARQNMRKEIVS